MKNCEFRMKRVLKKDSESVKFCRHDIKKICASVVVKLKIIIPIAIGRKWKNGFSERIIINVN
jgi:hypothetical protein